jgi:hypothetical protein
VPSSRGRLGRSSGGVLGAREVVGRGVPSALEALGYALGALLEVSTTTPDPSAMVNCEPTTQGAHTMTAPELPNDPHEVRRIADELLKSAIPDDSDIEQADGIIEIVEVLAKGVLTQALEEGADLDEWRGGVTRLLSVRIDDLGANPHHDEKRLASMTVTEFAAVKFDLDETLKRLRITNRAEFYAAVRIVLEEDTPRASIVILGGLVPSDVEEIAGTPFVICASAHTEGKRLKCRGYDGDDILNDSRSPDELRATVREFYALGERSQ